MDERRIPLVIWETSVPETLRSNLKSEREEQSGGLNTQMASAKERDGSLTRTTRLVLTISAAIEGATAIAIILNAEFVFQLVLGTGLSSAGIAVARVAAFGLLALAIACWPSGRTLSGQAVRALFVYNLLAGLYLGYLRVAGEFAGYLLWPACLLHVVLALLLARPACLRKLRFDEI